MTAATLVGDGTGAALPAVDSLDGLAGYLNAGAESIGRLSEGIRDLSSALIDYRYRAHIDGHLTHRIGGSVPEGDFAKLLAVR